MTKEKTVTLPLSEYETLVSIERVAKQKIQKAREMIDSRSIRVRVIHHDVSFYSTGYGKVNNFGDVIIESSNEELQDNVRSLINDCINDLRLSFKKGACAAIVEYNSKGRLYRFFNKIKSPY